MKGTRLDSGSRRTLREGCTNRVYSVTPVPVHRVPRFLGDPTAASVRPTGILTCVGSVLRQWRLLLSSASPPSPPPCPPPSRFSLSSLSPSTVPPISFSLFLWLFSLSLSLSHSLSLCVPLTLSLFPYSCRLSLGATVFAPPLPPPLHHPLLPPPFFLLFLLDRVASCYSTTTGHYYYDYFASTSAFSTFSASWPSPPAESTCSLPHLSDPAPLSTNDQPLSLHRVPLFHESATSRFFASGLSSPIEAPV